jgi:hypothetical protein
MSDRGDRGARSESDSAATATGGSGTTIRGAILIGAAVLLGVVLLGRGIDTSLVPTSDENGGNAGSEGDGDGDTTPTPVTSEDGTPVTRAPGEVTVWVLNAGGPTGTAANGTQAAANAGYRTVPADNAPADVAQSIVYYVEGYQADAAAVATLLGFGPDRVQALPNPPPVPNGDLQGANVIAVLGPDFGQQPSG